MFNSQSWKDFVSDLAQWRERDTSLLLSGGIDQRIEDQIRGAIRFITIVEKLGGK
jgi:hypothetical protein